MNGMRKQYDRRPAMSAHERGLWDSAARRAPSRSGREYGRIALFGLVSLVLLLSLALIPLAATGSLPREVIGGIVRGVIMLGVVGFVLALLVGWTDKS